MRYQPRLRYDVSGPHKGKFIYEMKISAGSPFTTVIRADSLDEAKLKFMNKTEARSYNKNVVLVETDDPTQNLDV